MKNKKKIDSLKVISALVLGTLIGSVIGLLCAPEKGSNTRFRLMNGAKDMAEDLKRKMKSQGSSFRNKAASLHQTAEEKLNDLTNSTK